MGLVGVTHIREFTVLILAVTVARRDGFILSVQDGINIEINAI